MALPNIIASPEHLSALLAIRAKTGLRIGELLVEAGRVPAAVVQAAVNAQAAADSSGTNTRIGEVLVSMGAITQVDFDDFMEQQTGMPVLDVRHYPVNPAAVSRLSASAATMYACVPMDHINGSLVVAFGDKPQADQLAAVRFACGLPVVAFRASNPVVLKSLLARHYTTAGTTFIRHAQLDKEKYSKLASTPDGPAGLFRFLLANAINNNASDIHLRPQLDGTRKALLRVDGMFRCVQEIPAKDVAGVVRHLELLAGIDFMSRSASKEGRLAVDRLTSECP
jgi:hypothetical protein